MLDPEALKMREMNSLPPLSYFLDLSFLIRRKWRTWLSKFSCMDCVKCRVLATFPSFPYVCERCQSVVSQEWALEPGLTPRLHLSLAAWPQESSNSLLPWFSHLWNGDNKDRDLKGLLREINECVYIIYMYILGWCKRKHGFCHYCSNFGTNLKYVSLRTIFGTLCAVSKYWY